MGYTSVRKCIHIEIRIKFNLIHEKEWAGETVSNICNRYGRHRYRWIEMSEDFDVKQHAENIYERWRSENNKKLSDKRWKEDGETLERYGMPCSHSCQLQIQIC